MRKIYAASWNLFTLTAEADRVLCQLVMFLIVFFHLLYKMKYSCYQDCSVIHGWFVYCAFCWQMHRLSKSLEIRFRMASFSKMSLLTCPYLRRKRVEKSHAILELLMAFRSSISTGKPEQLLSLRLSLYTSNDLTYNSIRFKKPLDIFLTANSKKMFRRLFTYDFGCKQKALSDFRASSSPWKRANTGKPA